MKDSESGRSLSRKGTRYDRLVRACKSFIRSRKQSARYSRTRYLLILFVSLVCWGLLRANYSTLSTWFSPQSTQTEDFIPADPKTFVLDNTVEPASTPIIPSHLESLARDPCSVDTWYMKQKYDLSDNFHFSRRFVNAVSEPREADPSNRFGHFDPHPRTLSDSIITGWDTVTANYSDKPVVALTGCTTRQTLNIPVFSPLPATKTKGSNLIIGYATTASRIRGRLLSLQHGFAHTQVHLVVQFPTAEKAELEDVELVKQMNSMGIRTTLRYDDREYRTRWASLPKTLRILADDKTQWIMVSDDDSFVVSLPRLLTMLDRYDSKKFYFIGALTDKWQNTKFGAMSFGGSGTFLSLPLVDHLMESWDDCAGIEKYGGGDQRFTYCIYKNSWTRMTWEPTILNQNDAEGDLQGLFESGQRFGTLHRECIVKENLQNVNSLSLQTYPGESDRMTRISLFEQRAHVAIARQNASFSDFFPIAPPLNAALTSTHVLS
jgi:hypothetical protein